MRTIDTRPASAPDIAGVPVLIVDDHPGKRFALRSVLAGLDYAIVEAASGVEALRCVMAQDFAVILMDIKMPEMDGFETAQLVRQRQRSELTPIIFITGYGNQAEANVAAYDAGAADFIYSPVPPRQLRAKVAMFANLYVKAQALAVQARKTQETAGWLTLVTNAAPIGIFLTDEHQRYVFVNPRWTELTGIPAEEALGQSWGIVQDASRGDVSADLSADGVDLASTHRFAVTRGGGRRIVERSARQLPRLDDDVPAGWVGTVSDVTEEVAAKTEMAAARDAALAANLAQVNFAASASHELKTPTASILGFIEEVLVNEGLDDDDRRYLDIAHRNAQRLVTLIDDLMVVGEVDLGAARIALEPIEVEPVVLLVLASMSAAAGVAGVELVYAGAARTDPPRTTALADRIRLEQVLTNLVGNALKFTPAGGTVRVSVGGDEKRLLVEVADTGIGIDEAAIHLIFDRFYRTPLVLEQGIRGSGLGLAIARRMAEAQGGTLSVRSVLGQGSVFTLSLVAVVPVADDA
jgi:PAS domain S-box-containing protein